MPLMPSSS